MISLGCFFHDLLGIPFFLFLFKTSSEKNTMEFPLSVWFSFFFYMSILILLVMLVIDRESRYFLIMQSSISIYIYCLFWHVHASTHGLVSKFFFIVDSSSQLLQVKLRIFLGTFMILSRSCRWFAKRFLHPDVVSVYDYIFLWDEDLGVENFHPGRYIWVYYC